MRWIGYAPFVFFALALAWLFLDAALNAGARIVCARRGHEPRVIGWRRVCWRCARPLDAVDSE